MAIEPKIAIPVRWIDQDDTHSALHVVMGPSWMTFGRIALGENGWTVTTHNEWQLTDRYSSKEAAKHILSGVVAGVLQHLGIALQIQEDV